MMFAALIQAMEATWPSAGQRRLGPVTLRQGQGGGKRVSAASVTGPWTGADLDRAAAAFRAQGEAPLFQVLPQQPALDAALQARGYALVDPVLFRAAPVPSLLRTLPPLSAFPHWPPLQIAATLWAEAGIGPARLAVMDRAQGAKTAILARSSDRPAGVAFVAIFGGIAMLHALEVRPTHRRQGVGARLLAAAAVWAADHGATDLALAVTKANGPACALYDSLGMTAVPGYHYRNLSE